MNLWTNHVSVDKMLAVIPHSQTRLGHEQSNIQWTVSKCVCCSLTHDTDDFRLTGEKQEPFTQITQRLWGLFTLKETTG